MQKFLHFPLTKIFIGIVFCAGVIVIGQIFIEKLLGLFMISSDVKNLIEGVFIAVLAVGSYVLLFGYYEKRSITELSRKNRTKLIITGIILGALLQSLTILVIYLKGGYSVIAINPIFFIVLPLAMAISSGVVEEIIIRGIIFRIMEEKLGSYIALFISAFIFGLLHIANPNSSFFMAVGLAVQAGLLLGAAYIYARNLWFPIAIHFAWNFTQSGIYGAAVSGGTVSKTLVTSKIEGADWYTGGDFGPEGSVQATLFCLIATIILLILSHKKGRILLPYWRKKSQMQNETNVEII